MDKFPLGPQWPTIDPFLFVAHHHDRYPRADGALGPAAPLYGRDLGQDFSGRDGWSMYHGRRVPGFPQHPHRGFETVTYVREGSSITPTPSGPPRFGQGDTQWMTAGAGVQHSEMFPLLRDDDENPLELFQIWLNLPAADKMVAPYFTMFWSDRTPRVVAHDDAGRRTEVTVIAGALDGQEPPAPPPDSWAAKSDADVAIWHIRLEPEARWKLPAAQPGSERVLYAFEGDRLTIDGVRVDAGTGAHLRADVGVDLVAGPGGIDCLLLQGRPIAEPVARYGPFVMTTNAGIQQAFSDYQGDPVRWLALGDRGARPRPRGRPIRGARRRPSRGPSRLTRPHAQCRAPAPSPGARRDRGAPRAYGWSVLGGEGRTRLVGAEGDPGAVRQRPRSRRRAGVRGGDGTPGAERSDRRAGNSAVRPQGGGRVRPPGRLRRRPDREQPVRPRVATRLRHDPIVPRDRSGRGFPLPVARVKLVKSQIPLLDLLDHLPRTNS
ncbi:MAG: pirin-like C-terminal cupin domain-containing protein [Acidimicrobiales bacterium]